MIGAHFGVWLEKEISKFKDQNILLVEPVPYNVEILKKNMVNLIIFISVIMLFFLKKNK